jgi:hypothetical protein
LPEGDLPVIGRKEICPFKKVEASNSEFTRGDWRGQLEHERTTGRNSMPRSAITQLSFTRALRTNPSANNRGSISTETAVFVLNLAPMACDEQARAGECPARDPIIVETLIGAADQEARELLLDPSAEADR